MNIACFPSSFDPITKGHQNIIAKALEIFPRVHVAVCSNAHKKHWLPLETRGDHVRKTFQNTPRVQVWQVDGLLTDALKDENITHIVRGLRLHYRLHHWSHELFLALQYQGLWPHVQLCWLASDLPTLSSSKVRAAYAKGKDIRSFIPEAVYSDLHSKQKAELNLSPAQ